MKRILLTLILLILAISYFSEGFSRQDAKKKISLKKPDIIDIKFINYNNWSYVMRNNGSYMYDSPDADGNHNNAGGEFPRGSGVTTVYAGGIYIGTLKNGIPVVSETEFATEFQPGRIVNSGVPFSQLKAEAPLLSSNKVFLIDRNSTSDWPQDAPRDKFGNPALIADAQTWAVFNDIDTSLNSESPLESPNPGLGIQATLESYAFSGPKTGDVVYMRYTLTNKTNADYTQTYFAAWSDPDVGLNSSNDIVGTDTLRNMEYVYDNTNEIPESRAVGFDFLQGPVVHMAQIPNRDMLRNQNNKTIITFDAVENRFFPQTLDGNLIVLGAVSSGVYSGGTDPIDNGERYNLLRGVDKSSGNPKSGCGLNDYFVFRGNPITEQGTCDVMGSNNPMGGLFAYPSDQRIHVATGPFTIKAGGSQEIWVGVVGATGNDRLDAVANLFATDDFAQSFFNAGFPAPSAPLKPELSASSMDRKVVLTWKNNAEASEDLAGEMLGIETSNGFTADYVKNDFQGYRVYRSLTGLQGSYELLAEYDKVDAFGSVINRTLNASNTLEIKEIHLGDNTGLAYHFIDSNLVNGQNYFYSVTAYDAQPYIGGPDSMLFDGNYIAVPSGMPVSLESSILSNALSVVPAGVFTVTDLDARLDTNAAFHTAGNSDGAVTLEIVDPSKVRTMDYSIEFFKIPTDSLGGTLAGAEFLPASLVAYRFIGGDSVLTIDSRSDDPRTFYDKNANGVFNEGIDVILDESVFATSQAVYNSADKMMPVIVGGIKVIVTDVQPGVKQILCTANGTGPLVKPDMGCFAFNSSGFPTLDGNYAGYPVTFITADDGLNDRPNIPNLLSVPGAASAANGGKWGIHAGGTGTNLQYWDGTPTSFLYRVFRGPDLTNFARFTPFDWEIRFKTGGNWGKMAFTTNNIVNVPFETWRVGIGTYADTTDDLQCVPLINDMDGNDAFNILQQTHPISGGSNDPHTDWIYFYIPDPATPGRQGFNDYLFGTGNTLEIMARLVLVNWNGGLITAANWPANVNQTMPAAGTVFRFISNKPNAPGDIFTFSTTGNTTISSKKELKRAMKDIKVVPNPFYKFSSFETNLDKLIKFTNLPDECTIKIFTVSGDLIKTIKHNATSNNDRVNHNPYDQDFVPEQSSTSIEQWNLKTANGRYVASGMYIALIESNAGKRFVKFAIIQ